MRKSFLLPLLAALVALGGIGAAAVQAADSTEPVLKSGEHRAGVTWDTAAVSADEILWEARLARSAASSRPSIHVVQPGEKLGDIAKRYGVVDGNGDGDYLRLFYANPEIKDPNILEPGWKVRIPLPNENLVVREVPRPIIARGPPAGNSYQAGTPGPIPANTLGYGLLYRIRGCESYWDPNAPGNYTAQNKTSSASGAYQWLDSTWANRFGVPRAMMATPEQQEQVAREMFGDPAHPNTQPWESSRSCWG